MKFEFLKFEKIFEFDLLLFDIHFLHFVSDHGVAMASRLTVT